MKLLDFEVHIVVDDEELPEYETKYDEDDNNVSCWIPSKAGKSFSITVKSLRNRDVDTGVYAYADGSFVRGSVFDKGMMNYTTWDSVLTSTTTSKPLMFSPIELTDDDDFLHSTNTKNLGDITLEVKEVLITSRNAPFSGTVPNFTEQKVHERSKKAVVHKIKLGPETIIPATSFFKATKLSTLGTMSFKYRSIDILRADGIAPSPTAAPMTGDKRKASENAGENGEDEDAPEDADDDEGDQDQARLKALLEQVNSLEAKMAKNGSKSKSNKKVKRERHPVFLPGEVIDLSEM